MDTQHQIDNLIELAIVQRAELKQLVEQIPQLREHLTSEIEKTFEAVEPELRQELEEFFARKTEERVDLLRGEVSERVAEMLKSLEMAAAAKYSALMTERARNAELLEQAEQKIAEAAASIPGKVKDIVTDELARFPRAGEIDQLRKEFAEPRGLNPRGKWLAGESYNKLDLVTINGDSYVSNIDGNTEKPSRGAANWTLNAARGNSGGGGGITNLNELLGDPSAGDIVGSSGTSYVRKTLTAGTGITITDDPSTITIDASGAQEILTATVKNAESVAITKGQVVYLFGATGNMPSVKLAYNTSDATSAKTFGVVSSTSISPNGTGTVTCVGVLDGLNLGAFNEGDTVYLGATPGTFTATKPYAPNHLVYVGIVERANAGNGELYVKIQNGYELDEIHDVQINSPRLSGQTLIYDATTSLWKNAQLTAGVGVSISNGASSITISADGGVNYQGTWNASTNTPTLTSSVGTKGFYYVVSVAGTTNLNGVTDWQVGDWAIFNGTAWEKVDTTDQVSSVFGRTGAVVGVSTDYSAVGITNTAIGASNPSTGAFTSLSSSSTTTLNGTTIPASKTLVVTTDKLSALASTSSAELAGVISDETGTGALVFANTPTLVTPILGTPQSGTLTNCTGLPVSTGVSGLGTNVATALATNVGTAGSVIVNGGALGTPSSGTLTNATGLPIATGVSGLGTNVATFLATPSSANLAAAVSDETGTGALVFANTPTLVTPNIGAATGTSFNLSGSGTLGTTLVVNGTTDSSSKDTGAIVTEGGLGVEKSATIGGNAMVAGTLGVGPSSTLGTVNITTPNLTYGTVYLNGATTGADFMRLKSSGADGVFGIESSVGSAILSGSSANATVLYSVGSNPLQFGTAGSVKGTLTSGGNLLIGTTTDSSNGRLQLATHTTSAGGIGFGTDISLYRVNPNSLKIGLSAANFTLDAGGSGTGGARIVGGGGLTLTSNTGESLYLQSGGLVGITINSSQQVHVNATTASTSSSTGALTVGGGVGVAGNLNVGGEIQISSAYPAFKLTDTNSNSDFTVLNDNGRLVVYDETNAAYRLTIGATGGVKIGTTPEDVGANNLTVQGTLAVSGGSVTLTGAAYSIFYADGSSGGNFTIRKAGVAYGTLYGNETNTVLDSAGSANLILQTGGATRVTMNSTRVSIPLTTASTSTSTGALVVSGGVGVAGAVYAGGKVVVNGGDASAAQFAVASASGTLVANLTAGSTTNQSFGLRMFAGTSASDYGLFLRNVTDTTTLFKVDGVGGTTVGGTLTVNNSFGVGAAPTSSWASGYYALEVGNTSTKRAALFANADNNLWLLSNAYFDGSSFKRFAASSATGYEQVNGEHKWSYAASGSAGASISFTTGMTLNSSGNLQIAATTASTSTSTGALVVSGGVGVAGNLNVGGTLNQFGTIGTPSQVAVAMQNTSARFRERNITNDFAWTTNIDDGWVQDNSSYASWGIRMGGGSNTFRIGQKAAGGAGDLSTLLLLNSTGNLLIGTTTDSSNGKLQLTTHTTSAGGIGFGTDTSLYRGASNELYTNAIAFKSTNASPFYIANTTNNIVFQPANTTTLTLTSGGAQIAATTASTSTSTGALVVSGGVGVAGALYVGSKGNFQSNDDILSLKYATDGGSCLIQWKNTSGTALWSIGGGIDTRQDELVFRRTTTTVLNLDSSNNATFAGNIKTAAPAGGTAAAWKLGTVATVSPTSPNRTIEVDIGGTIYYIHAKTTNN